MLNPKKVTFYTCSFYGKAFLIIKSAELSYQLWSRLFLSSAAKNWELLIQGYYNTGWFNSKIRSRANLLICQQTNIKAKLKCFSDKVPDFRIEPTFNCKDLDNKLCYEKITLAGMGVEVNHETLISHSWRCQMGTEYLLRGGVAKSSVLYSSFQGEC